MKFDVVSCVYSLSWTTVDRHRTRKNRQKLSGGVASDDQIATPWRFNTSRRRRSSKIRRPGINISIQNEFTSHWSIQTWISFSRKGGGPKKRFQYCLNLASPEHFLHIRAIQGHSGGALVDPTLQDNVLLPDDFIEYIYHVGNAHDLHSIIQSGLIPGGQSLKKDKHAVCFTTVNPMSVDQHEEVDYDLKKPRIAVYKNTWKNYQHTENWCNLKVAQKKGLQFYQTRSNAVILYNTLLAICIEKVSLHEVWRRIVQYKCINLQGYRARPYSRRLCIMDVRIFPISKREHPPTIKANRARSTGKPVAWSSRRLEAVTWDFRIQGLPHWTVQEEDDVRRETVKKLIHQFETHPNRESLMADLNKTQNSIRSAKSRRNWSAALVNTEHFELCEISSKIQCPDCSLYGDIGIILYVRKTLAAVGQRSTVEQGEIRRLVNPQLCQEEESVPWSSTRTDYEAENLPQIPQYAQKGLEKAVQHNLGKVPNKFSLSGITDQHWLGWERHNGDHSYNATRGERSRNERSWRLVLNAEGAQGPLDQRDDNKQAKETCNKMYKEHAATAGCGNAPIHPQQQVRQKSNQQFEGHEEDSYRLDSSGWRCIVPATMHYSLRHLGGKSQTAGGRGTGQLHHGVNSDFCLVPDETFRLQIIQSPGNRRGCNKYTYRAHVFLMRSLSAFLSQSLVTVCSPG